MLRCARRLRRHADRAARRACPHRRRRVERGAPSESRRRNLGEPRACCSYPACSRLLRISRLHARCAASHRTATPFGQVCEPQYVPGTAAAMAWALPLLAAQEVCYATPCYAMLCYATLRYAMLCNAMPCHAMRCPCWPRKMWTRDAPRRAHAMITMITLRSCHRRRLPPRPCYRDRARRPAGE